MIFYAYLDGMYSQRKKALFGETPKYTNDFKDITSHLENSNDYFVFIIVPSQEERFFKYAEEYGWKKYIHYDMGKYVTNRRYLNEGRRLRLIILKGNKNGAV